MCLVLVCASAVTTLPVANAGSSDIPRVLVMSHPVEIDGKKWVMTIQGRDDRYGDSAHVDLARTYWKLRKDKSVVHKLTETQTWSFGDFDTYKRMVEIADDGSGYMRMPAEFRDVFATDISIEPIEGETPETYCGRKTIQEVAVSEGSTVKFRTGNEALGTVEGLPDRAVLKTVPCKVSNDPCPERMRTIQGSNQGDRWFDWSAGVTPGRGHARLEVRTNWPVPGQKGSWGSWIEGKIPRSRVRIEKDLSKGLLTTTGLPRLSGWAKAIGKGTYWRYGWPECGPDDASYTETWRSADQQGTLTFRPTGMNSSGKMKGEFSNRWAKVSRYQIRPGS